jgi:hypothetical protein
VDPTKLVRWVNGEVTMRFTSRQAILELHFSVPGHYMWFKIAVPMVDSGKTPHPGVNV